ncbi:hypothetical protein D9M69_433590 [compost metagenome]
MRPCRVGKRHKWSFVKNVIKQVGSARSFHISKRGFYRCECGETKYGESQMPVASPEVSDV